MLRSSQRFSPEQEKPSVEQIHEEPKRRLVAFYLWRLISAIGDRSWPFAYTFMMLALPEGRTLRWVAFSLFTCSLASLAVSHALKKWAKLTDCWQAVFISGAVQKLSTCVASSFLLMRVNEVPILLMACFFITVSHLASQVYQHSIENIWLPLYCDGNVTGKVKTWWKAIDYVMAIAAPFPFAFAMNIYGTGMLCLIVILWQFGSTVAELALLLHIHGDNKEVFNNRQIEEDTENNNQNLGILFEPLYNMERNWRKYNNHSFSWMSWGFSLLFFTVLSLDPITVGYLHLNCMDAVSSISIRSAGWIVGIIALNSYLRLSKPLLGLRISSLTVYILHVVTIIACFAAFALPGISLKLDDDQYCSKRTLVNDGIHHNSLHIPILAVALLVSRFTLWSTDTCFKAVFDENVTSAADKNMINQVQGTFCDIMNLARLFIVFLIPYPSLFGWNVLLTLCVVACGAVFFGFGCPNDVASNLAKRFSKNRK